MAKIVKDTNKDFIDVEYELDNLKDILDKEDIAELKRVYKGLKNTGKLKARKIREIVPADKWVNDEYYVGKETYNIYPYWKQALVEVVNSPVKINQVILTGAIGTGKTMFGSLLLIRRIYELSCYENIAALFNLFGVSRIAFAYLSVTKEQAQNSGFALLTEWLDAIPYFKECFPRRQALDSLIVFPQERLFVLFGSVANHFIGMNLLGSILDEANFFEGRQKDDANLQINNKVANLYSQIITRSESRFIVNGQNYSLSILISSSTTESSFTERQIEKNGNKANVKVFSPSQWDVKPLKTYSGKKFLVFVGGTGLDPFIIKTIADINLILESFKCEPLQNTNISLITDLVEVREQLPSEVREFIIEVPIEYYNSFSDNTLIALQDLAGYSINSSSKFFSNHLSYNKCISPTLSHPFTKEIITLSTTDNISQKGYLPIKAYLKPNIKFINLDKPRYMHLDLALTSDSVGISMGHISSWTNIYKQDINEDNDLFTQARLPKITIDFMLKIAPPDKPNRISFSKIRDFILFLRDEMHIKFELITADQFQSAQLIQELNELGFKTAYLSVDRTTKPYNTLGNLIYENRVDFYDYEPFSHELFNLIFYPAKKKIDHPAKGSKDVSDSVAGTVFNIIESSDKSDVSNYDLIDSFVKANNHNSKEEDMIEYAKSLGNNILGIPNKDNNDKGGWW